MGFKDIGVKYKLALIGAVAFVATVFVGILGYWYLRSAQEAMAELYNEHTMGIFYCARVRNDTRVMQVQSSLMPFTIDNPSYILPALPEHVHRHSP